MASRAQGASQAAHSLLRGPLLHDVVNIYNRTFCRWALPCDSPTYEEGHDAWERVALTDFDRRYALGQRALAALDFVAGGAVDAAAAEGHLLHCSRTAATVGGPLPPRAMDARGKAF